MIEKVEQLLKAREELLTWWGELQMSRDSEPHTKIDIAIDSHQVEAFFSTPINLTVKQFGAHSSFLSSIIADYVRENAETIVSECYYRALTEINSKLAESKVELQKLLESI